MGLLFLSAIQKLCLEIALWTIFCFSSRVETYFSDTVVPFTTAITHSIRIGHFTKSATSSKQLVNMAAKENVGLMQSGSELCRRLCPSELYIAYVYTVQYTCAYFRLQSV